MLRTTDKCLYVIWIIVSYFAHIVAADTVRYLAFNITNSYAIPDCKECHKFTWDANLKIACYSLYVLLFSVITAVLLYINKRWNNSRVIKHISLIVFIMIFPTHTMWGVASLCRGGLGCANGYYFQLIVPSILSINPISIIITSFIAYKIAHKYFERINNKYA